MYDSIIAELYSFFIFIICGAIIGILFDIFRILRKSFKTSDLVTSLEDIMYWILSGIIFIFVLFKYNNGQIRNYVIIGLFLGSTIYLLTLSKYFINISVIILLFIKKIVMFPVVIVLKLIKYMLKPFSFVVINIRKICHNMMNNIKHNKNIYKK